jgi:hypothetical protein
MAASMQKSAKIEVRQQRSSMQKSAKIEVRQQRSSMQKSAKIEIQGKVRQIFWKKKSAKIVNNTITSIYY